MIPTMMKPMTGLTFSRAKAGMTIPAAPRMVSASLRPVPAVTPVAIPSLEQGAPKLSPDCDARSLDRRRYANDEIAQGWRPGILEVARRHRPREGREENYLSNHHQESQGRGVDGQSRISGRNGRGQTSGAQGRGFDQGLKVRRTFV